MRNSIAQTVNLGDETLFSAEEHRRFLTYILGIYNPSRNNIVYLIGDNLSTNKSFEHMAFSKLKEATRVHYQVKCRWKLERPCWKKVEK